MKKVIPFVLAGFVFIANPAHATFSNFPTCDLYASFLSGLITKIESYLVYAPPSLRPTLIAARSLYGTKLALVKAGNYNVVLVGGVRRCLPHMDHASRT